MNYNPKFYKKKKKIYRYILNMFSVSFIHLHLHQMFCGINHILAEYSS